MTKRLLVLIVALNALACTPATIATLGAEGFAHGTYNYKIKAREVASGTEGVLLPAEWELDNLYETEAEVLEAKTTAEYQVKVSFDLDGDGEMDKTEELLAYDLRFKHRVHSGVIWVRTLPISQALREKDLRVLMQEYIDAVAGAGYERVSFVMVEERRYAAETLSRESGTIAGKAAFAAKFAVANVDQLKVSKDARRVVVRLVILRPGFDYEVKSPVTREQVKFPVLFVAGYASQPEDFEQGVRDFDDLLTRLVIDGASGVELQAFGSDASQAKKAGEDEAQSVASPVKDATSAAGEESQDGQDAVSGVGRESAPEADEEESATEGPSEDVVKQPAEALPESR